MKVAICALLLGATLVLGVPLQNFEERDDGWFVPQADGSFEWVSKEDYEEFVHNYGMSGRAATIKLFLYTRTNPKAAQEIDVASYESLKNSHYSSKRPTRLVIHGWQSSAADPICTMLRDSYLAHEDVNVICVDWSENAQSLNYALEAQRVKGVGKQVAAFIDLNNEHNGMSFETLEIDGHSLGAHCAGFAGKNVKRGQVHVIRGLDPALPLFSYDDPSGRLNRNDAYYVESIQTDGGQLGFLKPIGKAAFYPNGGKSQPGCGIDLTGSCAHSRSFQYYAEAITKDDFPSMRCTDYEQAVDKNCGKTYSSNKLGAESNEYSADGSYYTPVNKKSPFGLGA